MATFNKAATGAGTGDGSNSGGLGFVTAAVGANQSSVITTPVGVLNATAVVVARANQTTCGPRQGVTTTGNESKVKV